MKTSTKKVVYSATVMALLFVARLLDRAITQFLPVNAAIITLIVAFACLFIWPDFINSIVVGTMFGVCSLLASIIFPGGFTMYFVNPLVSVLPRIIVCVVAFFVYKAITLLIKNTVGKIIAIVVACAVGAVVNTFTVMTMIYLFMMVANSYTPYEQVIGLVLTFNTLFEVIIPPVVTPLLTFGVRRGLKIGEDKPTVKTEKVEGDNQ
ncbi:MAG: ECF transporter S component [Clostridia bacterium]|nr:ECF transporter S component [Clostridia bacterium]